MSAKRVHPTGYLFWFWMLLLFSAILGSTGGLFAIDPYRFIGGSRGYVLLEHAVPGGLQTHGAVWLTFAFLITGATVAERYGRVKAKVLTSILALATLDLTWTAIAFGLAGRVGGKTTWIGVIIWSGLALWPFLSWVLRPTWISPAVCRMRDELVDNGLSREAADRIALCAVERRRVPSGEAAL